MGAIGAPELIIVLLIILLIFGGTKLPKLARSLGEAQREFRAGQDEAARNAAASPPKDETPSS
jgi:sec-independent protein translocase protein TatA